MQVARIAMAVGLLTVLPPLASAQFLNRPLVSKPMTAPLPSGFESIDALFKTDVLAVVTQPLIASKFTEDAFAANPTVYTWLLDHPDRTSLAWERVGVPCLPIRDSGKGVFQFKDEQGHDVSWQKVGTLTDGRIWYATGKVKPGALVPTIPVKAVAMIRHPQTAQPDGTIRITPTINVYFQTESRAAATVMRIAGPAAPRMAEDAAEQLLFFFSGMTKYLNKHPDQITALLSPPKTR